MREQVGGGSRSTEQRKVGAATALPDGRRRTQSQASRNGPPRHSIAARSSAIVRGEHAGASGASSASGAASQRVAETRSDRLSRDITPDAAVSEHQTRHDGELHADARRPAVKMRSMRPSRSARNMRAVVAHMHGRLAEGRPRFFEVRKFLRDRVHPARAPDVLAPRSAEFGEAASGSLRQHSVRGPGRPSRELFGSASNRAIPALRRVRHMEISGLSADGIARHTSRTARRWCVRAAA